VGKRCEVYDEIDLDTALARFDELSQPTPRLGNEVSRAYGRLWTYVTAGDWAALTDLLAEDLSFDDRRRTVNAGVRHGRAAEIANLRAIAGLGILKVTPTVIATRGERLALNRVHMSDRGDPGAFYNEVLSVVEMNANELLATVVLFDLEDFDAAVVELDARYVAGEAVGHAHMWSMITDAFTATNRREFPPTTADYVIVDHRLQHATSGAAGLAEYLNASWDLTPDLRMYVEAVHQLSDAGAVITLAARGSSREGFDADWRLVELLTGTGELGHRCEVFDEADLDAALARFEELQPQVQRAENTASEVAERFLTHFASRDWDVMSGSLSADYSSDDRRQVVGAGLRHGRNAAIENYRAMADVGFRKLSPTVVATRGQRLAVVRVHAVGVGPQPEAFRMELSVVVEIERDRRIRAVVVFDSDDIGGALAELDARYLAGEAAPYSHTWSVITSAYAGFNRGELPAPTGELASVDHRRVAAMAPGEGRAYFHASWELAAELSVYIESVHLLSDFGAVLTHVGRGTSRDGFEAEWRTVDVMAVDGDLINRGELFDEADLDAALARFEELSQPAQCHQNTASGVDRLFWDYFGARDWAAITSIVDDDVCIDDRRRVVSAGIAHGKTAHLKDLQSIAEVGAEHTTSTVIATRGTRLALTRVRSSYRGLEHGDISVEVLCLVELGAHDKIVMRVGFDLDDIDDAFAELDGRYLAGEAKPEAHTWSVITRSYAGFNRHELPASTQDWSTVDHRRVTTMAPGDLIANLRESWQITSDLKVYIEAVHQLSEFGSVFTHAAKGTSQEGFEAEWRAIDLVMVQDDQVTRAEIFDEADLDAALSRFDELH
jgi:hypothetical protein